MSIAQPIVVYGITFPTKKALTEFMRRLVAKYLIGQDLEPTDLAFCLDLLLYRHRWAATKVGSGVVSMQIERNQYNHRTIWLTRKDGSRSDWSWTECISPPTHQADVKSACRNAIRSQIEAFRMSSNATHCPITGEPLDMDTCEVDHIDPFTFDNIFKVWIKRNNLDIEKIVIGGYDDGDTEKYIVDPNIANSWQTFHRRSARLRLISADANRRLGATKYKAA